MKDHNNDDGDRGYKDGMALKKTLGDESTAFENGYILALIKRISTILYKQPDTGSKDKDA